MTTADGLNRGREAYRRWAWGDAYALLSAADADSPLDAADIDRLAIAAYLCGKDSHSGELLTRAHNDYLHRGDIAQAVRCAFWLGFELVGKGEMARAGGWFARAQRLLDESNLDCVERGYLLVPMGIQTASQGEHSASYAMFAHALEIGERFADLDLVTIARHGQGRSLIHLGEVARGVSLLDEVMVAVTAGEVTPIIAGIVYCSVIEACHEIFDLRRAHEWTEALTRWCESQQDLVPYRGQCLLHRAEIMQLRGAWHEAMEEAQRAYERLSQPPVDPAVGAAFYRQAELHRLRGEYSRAESAFREASRWGHRPEPGLALLRLAQGQPDVAAATIRRVMEETAGPISRSTLLPAFVEIMIASGDIQSARAAAGELAEIARDLSAPVLSATADSADGAVSLAEGDALRALGPLRRAWAAWQALDAPYEAALVRVRIGLACRDLGDQDTARLEFDAAQQVFEELGAEPDIARAAALSGNTSLARGAGLTGREMEVLRLIAAGNTNRAIAAELVISEKTVARHVSNIFTKLGLSSRSAATAFAYEHGLLS
jgi:DNA-binding CsgD family transcriptional regulator